MKRNRLIVTLLVLAAGAGAALYYFSDSSNEEVVEYTTEVVGPKRITKSVTATGTVEPVNQVEVGTQVSGILTNLYVDYNSIVKKGQVIAELDKSTLVLDLGNKESALSIAKSKYEYELANYTRIERLHKDNLVADSEYETALYSYQSSKNSYESAKNDLKRSQTNLGYATITSPIDGVVLSKSVEEGQTVASSFNTPTLFTIAANLEDMQVIADVDEADIGNVTEGQSVEFTVDAFPEEVFQGIVSQVRQLGVVESNVVTYEVVISAHNPELKLKPGLTATVEIFTLDKNVSVAVPVSALSFRMPTSAQSGEHPAGQARPERPVDGEHPAGQARPERQSGDEGAKRGGSRVMVKNNGEIEPRRVEVGITNGIFTEVSGLSVGDTVVTGVRVTSTSTEETTGEVSPFMPSRPGGGGRRM